MPRHINNFSIGSKPITKITPNENQITPNKITNFSFNSIVNDLFFGKPYTLCS